eukprot:COSAG01_NODE_778_length_13681_cov_15.265130_6_plen_89_part_00
MTEIYLCDVGSCQEILRSNGRGQLAGARAPSHRNHFNLLGQVRILMNTRSQVTGNPLQFCVCYLLVTVLIMHRTATTVTCGGSWRGWR